MEKDLIKVIQKYTKYWYYFIISILICSVLAFLYLRYKVTPEYFIEGKVLLNDKENGGADSGLGSLSNLGLIKTSNNIQDQIGILQSFDLMKETVEDLGLAVGYYAEGRFSEIELYKTSVPFKVILSDSSTIQSGILGKLLILDKQKYQLETLDNNGKPTTQTYRFNENVKTNLASFSVVLKDFNAAPSLDNPITIRIRDLKNLILNYNSKLTVSPVFTKSGGGLLQLSLQDAIPNRGVDVISKLINVYAKNSADHKNILAKATLGLIDERLELLTSDLNSAEKDVEDYKQSKNLTDVSSDASRFIRLADEADRELLNIRSQISAIDALESSLNQSSNNFSTISSYSIQNPVLNNIILSYNEQVQRRKGIIRSSGAGNPLLIEIDKQLNDMRNLILSNIKNVSRELEERQRIFINKSSQFKGKVSSVPTAERALLGINRDQGIKNQLYLYLLQKREEEALSISVPFSDVRIIETPTSSSYPVTGGKTPVYLGAFLLGLLIPFSVIFSKNMLNTKVVERSDIEDSVSMPVLGIIASHKSKSPVVVTSNAITPVAELFRLMRYNLKFFVQDEGSKVLMVTSGKQGEGKTFISINLALSFAITGKKVVALGFDLRVPKLMKDMNLKYEKGISDYIIDSETEINDMIIPYESEDNLHFIGSGSIPPNPGELILNKRVGLLIDKLKERYDYIIIDTAPIGKVADGFSLAPFIDVTLFVVRSNYTKKEELSIVDEIDNNQMLKPSMVVLNDVKLEKNGAYSYGYTKSS